MKAAFTDLMFRGLLATAAGQGERARLSVLIYHRVLPSDDPLNNWDVTARIFDAQMRALAARFSILPLSEAAARLTTSSLPAWSACVTFDDGYADNAEVALPILRKYNVPATFFIATGYLDGGRMWNDAVVESIRAMRGPTVDLGHWGLGTLELGDGPSKRVAIRRILGALKYRPTAEREACALQLAEQAGRPASSDLMMRTSHVRSLHAAGMEIGAHTVTHPILTNTSDEEARREIRDSGEHLADILRVPIKLFAYPNGKPGQDYSVGHVRMVRDAGYRAAVSTSPGAARHGADVFQLPRFTPWDRTPDKFTLRLVRNGVGTRPDVVGPLDA